jgi:ABC-type branched-subunit amino acid transport system substrate-binding protein
LKRTLALVAALTAAGSLIAACASGSDSASGGSGDGPAQPGVSGKTITLSVISDNSGPVAGAFKGAYYGAAAYADYVNATGGVGGYQLKVTQDDSQTTCQGAATAAQQAVQSSFAIVGGISLSDQCEVPYLKAHPDTPFVASGLSPQVEALPSYYSIDPEKPGTQTGPFLYLARAYPAAVRKAAELSGTTAGAISYQGYANAAMKAAGYQMVYQRAIDPTVTDFTADIVRMRNAGVQYLFLNMFGQQIADILDQMAQQNWHPQIVQSVNAYVANWFQTTKPGANENLIDVIYTAMYLDAATAGTPQVALFSKWLGHAAHGFPPDIYSIDAWGDMALFAHTLKASLASAKGGLTQAGVMKALAATRTFTDQHMFAPAGIAARKPPTCWLIVKATSAGAWQRLAPASGFQCSPGGYLAAGN